MVDILKRKIIEVSTKGITFDRGYDEFIFNCRAKNLRPATIQFYDNSIKSIYKFIDPKMPIRDITKATVDSFIIGRQNELDIKDITIHTYLRTLKAILYYFMKVGYMEKFHIPLVKYDKPVIETYTNQFDDLVQAGTVGLINAANKYNNELENKAGFITYAFQYIKREIFSCVNGRSEKEISNNRLYNSCVSLDVPIQEDNDIQLRDTIESIDYGFENVEETIYIKQLREELENAMLNNNTLKEREILQLCYGWDYQKAFTYKEAAEVLKLNQNNIPQIEFNALRKLRNSTWGKEKVKEYMRDKVESIMENSRYNQDKVIDKINLIDKYFSGVI